MRQNNYALVTTTIRYRFDFDSTAYDCDSTSNYSRIAVISSCHNAF